MVIASCSFIVFKNKDRLNNYLYSVNQFCMSGFPKHVHDIPGGEVGEGATSI